MSPEQKVVVITGASRGIGASLTKGFRELGYGVVVNARSIDKLGANDPNVVAVAGDVAKSDTADRIIRAALDRFGRIDTLVNNAGIFISRPFTDYSESDYAAVTGVSLARVLPCHPEGRALHAGRRLRPHRHHHGSDRRAAHRLTAGGARGADQGWPQRGDAGAGDRICPARRARERRLTGRHPHTHACARDAQRSSTICSRWDAWARPGMSSMPCSISRRRPSSPARSFTSTAVRPPAVAKGGCHVA